MNTPKLKRIIRCTRLLSRGRRLALSAVLFGGIFGLANPKSAVAEDNIAMDRPYTMTPQPNYKLCTDVDDDKQLTDGQFAPQSNSASASSETASIWTMVSTVGWVDASPVIIEIDLGESQPISGVSFSTAARSNAAVEWPQGLLIFVSDDAQTWQYVGDLVTLSGANGEPPTVGRHEFVTHDLKTIGRYVTVAVTPISRFTFSDEIEVYAGEEGTAIETGPTTDNVPEFVKVNRVRRSILKRVTDDLEAVWKKIVEARPAASTKAELEGQLQLAEKELAEMVPPDDEEFKAILPLNATHAKILGVFGKLLAAGKVPALFPWKQHRYDYLPWLATPKKAEEVKLSVEMMGDEFRADSFLLTNASDQAASLTIKVSGLPGGPKPEWLDLSMVPWTGTSQFQPVADALISLKYSDGAFHLELPPGMTLKLWASVDSSKLPAGSYEGTVQIEKEGTEPMDVPLAVKVASVSMARPRLSLCMWDYSNGNGHRGITKKNAEACRKMMRSHFVDSPWALSTVLPQTANPSFAALDAWISDWPDARQYFVFANVRNSFDGAEIGTPEFDRGVGEWAKAIAEHMSGLGLKSKQLAVCLIDEPITDTQDKVIAAWARAIRAATSDLGIFEDPIRERPDQAKIQEAITLADVLCPKVETFLRGGTPVSKYFSRRREAGQSLWFYQCSGPIRHFDPQGYYRNTAWLAFQHGAVGMGFWAFGDLGAAPSSWNEYAGHVRFSFAPAFVGEDDVTDSIHWQAVREGVEDYEYLAMLNDVAQKSKVPAWKTKANELLKEVRNRVSYPERSKYDWNFASEHDLLDTYRLRALQLLDEHQKEQADSKDGTPPATAAP